jgi:ankyrin repeat protein
MFLFINFLIAKKLIKKLLEESIIITISKMELNCQILLNNVVQTDKCELTDVLIKMGANVNHVDVMGKFPLYFAYEKNMISQMQILLSHGADVNKMYDSRTILYHECNKQKPNNTIIKLLMDNNADPNIISDLTFSPPLARLVEEKNIDSVELLISYPRTNINLQDGRSITPFRIACAHGYDKIAMLLLNKGADPNIQGKEGYSALMRTIINAMPSTLCVLLLHADIVKLDLQDKDGNTALHHAYLNNQLQSVLLLLKYGANRTIKNNDGNIPAHCSTSEHIRRFNEIYDHMNSKKEIHISPTELPQTEKTTDNKKEEVCNVSQADLIFTVPNPNNKQVKYAIPTGQYQIWNSVFKDWNNEWNDLPKKEMKCEYIDEKVSYHIAFGDGCDFCRIRFNNVLIDGICVPFKYE